MYAGGNDAAAEAFARGSKGGVPGTHPMLYQQQTPSSGGGGGVGALNNPPSNASLHSMHNPASFGSASSKFVQPGYGSNNGQPPMGPPPPPMPGMPQKGAMPPSAQYGMHPDSNPPSVGSLQHSSSYGSLHQHQQQSQQQQQYPPHGYGQPMSMPPPPPPPQYGQQPGMMPPHPQQAMGLPQYASAPNMRAGFPMGGGAEGGIPERSNSDVRLLEEQLSRALRFGGSPSDFGDDRRPLSARDDDDSDFDRCVAPVFLVSSCEFTIVFARGLLLLYWFHVFRTNVARD